MDPETFTLLRAMAWHQGIQTYLLIALALGTPLGIWAIAREVRAVGRMAHAVVERLNHRP